MAVDINRVVASAIEAAIDDEHRDHHEGHRRRHSGVKAMAAGAALVAAVQVVRSQAPKLSKLGALTTLGKVTHLPDMVRDVPDRLRDRLADTGLMPDDGGPEDDELEQDEDLEEDEDYDEPEDEGDEGPGDEGDDWPDSEDDGGGAAAEPEPDPDTVGALHREVAVEQAEQGLGTGTNGDRSSASGAIPEVIEMLRSHRPPPLLTDTENTREIDSVARPPEPPTKASSSESGPSKARSGGSKA